MNPTAVEESSEKRIPHNLETVVKSLEGSEESSSSTNENDLVAVLLYVLMIETGYSPVNVEGTSLCSYDHGFSIHKLNLFSSMPANWKNIHKNSYEISFVLGRFTQYPCRMLLIPLDDVLIINLIVSNLAQERNRYTLGIQPSKYVVNPTSSCIPAKFSNLKDLSLKFKNNVSHPARSVILTKEGILNASLLGVPDEVKIKVFKYLRVSHFLKVTMVCRDFYCMSEDPALWKYFFVRDFICKEVADIVNQPGESTINWKEEYQRRCKSSNTRRILRNIYIF